MSNLAITDTVEKRAIYVVMSYSDISPPLSIMYRAEHFETATWTMDIYPTVGRIVAVFDTEHWAKERARAWAGSCKSDHPGQEFREKVLMDSSGTPLGNGFEILLRDSSSGKPKTRDWVWVEKAWMETK